ncbi:hypothetical protein PoB_004858700 [Plakobranchus ocellatus]|uniref:Secreted protein n=1 Tax=Plakobranchus ocellatus TaxID=259542 RepID=A0AAV4BSW7_9GAST|nr:hypothetical protein PoB_004858700 [Plakobranchus ocellatus]
MRLAVPLLLCWGGIVGERCDIVHSFCFSTRISGPPTGQSPGSNLQYDDLMTSEFSSGHGVDDELRLEPETETILIDFKSVRLTTTPPKPLYRKTFRHWCRRPLRLGVKKKNPA